MTDDTKAFLEEYIEEEPTPTTHSTFEHGDHSDLIDALNAIPCHTCDHDTWMKVGTALKHSGVEFEAFDTWSSTDMRHGQYIGTYGTMAQWDSFDEHSGPTSGFVIRLAESFGWQNSGHGGKHAHVHTTNDLTDEQKAREAETAGYTVHREGMCADGNPAEYWLTKDGKRYDLDYNEIPWEPDPFAEYHAYTASAPTAKTTSSHRHEFESINDLFREDGTLTYKEPVESLIEGLIDVGDISLFIGDTGLGKSWLMIQLGLSVATGRQFLGHTCKQRSVCFLNPEISEKKFRNRVRQTIEAMGLTRDDSGENFTWLTTRGESLDFDDISRRLRATGKHFDLLIFDSLFMLTDADENSAGEIKALFVALHRIAEEFGATIVISHHTGKATNGKRRALDRARGSSVFAGASDSMFTLDALAVDDESDAWEFIRHYDQSIGGDKVFARAVRLTSAKLRDHNGQSAIDLVFKWPLFITDETGELAECAITGSDADNGSKGGKASGVTRAQKADDDWAKKSDALDRIIMDLEEQGIEPTRKKCFEPYNEALRKMGYETITVNTFKQQTAPSGPLRQEVRPDSSYALWTPQFDTEESQ